MKGSVGRYAPGAPSCVSHLQRLFSTTALESSEFSLTTYKQQLPDACLVKLITINRVNYSQKAQHNDYVLFCTHEILY